MPRVVRAGDRDQLVSIQRIERLEDGGGGWEESWIEVTKAWAAVRPMSGRERAIAEQQEQHVGFEVTIPYIEGIDAGMSVLWRGKRLGIVWVADAGPKAGTIGLVCGTGEA